MRRHAALLPTLMACTMGVAQAPVFFVDTVKAQQPWYQHELYTFPVIRMPGHEVVAKRIDKDLCEDLLDVDPDTLKGPLFVAVWGDTTAHQWPRLNSLTWSCSRSFRDLLVCEFNGEGCGAYCEGFTMHHVYDLRNGRRIGYDSLFTETGLVALNDTLAHWWRPVVRKHLQALRDSVLDPSIPADMSDHFIEAVELYEGCLDERPEHNVYVEDMEPLPAGLRVFIARCSAHWNRNADELDPLSFVLPYALLSPYLKPELRPLFTR